MSTYELYSEINRQFFCVFTDFRVRGWSSKMTGQRRNSKFRLSGESKGKGSLARAVLEVSCGWTVDGCKVVGWFFSHPACSIRTPVTWTPNTTHFPNPQLSLPQGISKGFALLYLCTMYNSVSSFNLYDYNDKAAKLQVLPRI